VEFLDDVEHEVRDVVRHVAAGSVHAGQHDVLVVLGVARIADRADVRPDPLAALDPEVRDQLARLVERDAPLGEVLRQVGPQHLVDPPDARPVSAEPLEGVRGTRATARPRGRCSADVRGRPEGLEHARVFRLVVPLAAATRSSSTGRAARARPRPHRCKRASIGAGRAALVEAASREAFLDPRPEPAPADPQDAVEADRGVAGAPEIARGRHVARGLEQRRRADDPLRRAGRAAARAPRSVARFARTASPGKAVRPRAGPAGNRPRAWRARARR